MSELEQARRELERLEREERDRVWAEKYRCRVCGATERESILTSIDIVIARSEEGHAEIGSFLCEAHLIQLTDALVNMGLSVHCHGGICFLEDTQCPGAHHLDQCATPEDRFGERTDD